MRPASVLILLVVLAASRPLGAQPYSNTSTIVAAGGGPASSATHATTSTIGGVVAGTSQATDGGGTVYLAITGFAPVAGRADAQPSLTLVTPAAVPASGASRVVLTGSRLTGVTRVTVGGIDARWESDAGGTRLTIDVPARTPGSADIVVTTAVGQRTLPGAVSYEPRWLRYFAEGAQSAWFDTRLALFNPEPAPVVATLTYHVAGRDPALAPLSMTVTVPAEGRVTVAPGPMVGAAAFSTSIEAPAAIVAERTMAWPAGGAVASHAESAVAPPADRWYFAEGSLHRGLSTFFLLQNTGDVEAHVRARFLRAWPGAALSAEYVLPAHSRTTVWMDDEVRTRPSLADLSGAGEFGAEFVSVPYPDALGRPVDAPLIVVERALYLRDAATGAFTGGTASLGSTLLGQQWHFAEGATGSFFDEWLLLANPGHTDVDVRARFRTANGQAYQKSHVVRAGSRLSILVDDEQALVGIEGTPTPSVTARPLADTALSTVLDASGPIVAERSLWWPADGSAWGEGHTSAGLARPSERWAVAGAPAHASSLTYLLVANVTADAGLVRVTPTCEDGARVPARMFALPANRRINIVAEAPVRDDASGHALDGSGFGPALVGRGCAFLVEAIGLDGAAPPRLTVERSTYIAGAGRRPIVAGASAPGTVLP